MHSSPTSIVMHPPLLHAKIEHDVAAASQLTGGGVIFDPSTLRHLATSNAAIPDAFVWPRCDRAAAVRELHFPVVDLEGFLRGDEASTLHAAELIREACTNHGFFQVINHGVDPTLLRDALDCTSDFFGLPLCDKLRARRRPGSMWGYAGAHSDRFTSNLPWKETLSFGYHDDRDGAVVVDYFSSALGQLFVSIGWTYQKYCEAMKSLSQSIMELLAISLGGVSRTHYRDFYQEGKSIMRCNYYPPCEEPELTMGTGPHCDPTSLTILQQDDVEGLEVFTGGKWQSVRPVSGALVVNIGDTFMALSNGRYKSCLHRAVVNRQRARRSLAFFVCPPEEKVIRPARGADGLESPRLYPDFTWRQFLEFTQSHHRADVRTLASFVDWVLLRSSSSSILSK